MAEVNIFKEAKDKNLFVGRPFSLNYHTATLLVADAWKMKVGGIPQGTFLLAFYENEPDVHEALLLRALEPTKLPTSDDITRSMIEYYKDDLGTTGNSSALDDFTRYEFSFSGLACRVLGTFYRDSDGDTKFGADVENFYSPHHYNVFKPHGRVLELIANYHENQSIAGSSNEVKIGKVRYSSSIRFQQGAEEVPVYVSSEDFLGKRTALFGMTRTGKSNTVKKVIQASVELGKKAKGDLSTAASDTGPDFYEAFDPDRNPKFPIGQLIFDINGEYANANMQDEGTAIFEMYEHDVLRYSVMEKEGFKVMKVNFYKDVHSGFSLVQSRLALETGDYVQSFSAVDMSAPDSSDRSAVIRHERVQAAYMACLFRAGFKPPVGFKVKFSGNGEINKQVSNEGIDPSKGITLEQAGTWFEWVWDNYNDNSFFSKYRTNKGREWADENLQAMLVFLTKKRKPGGTATVSGYQKLRSLVRLHTPTVDKPFVAEIVNNLRAGKIIIVDLSQGDPEIQSLFSERICLSVFGDAMDRFVNAKPNNFIQFYFEEAHNLFPKKDDKDLSLIYNRIAKEGAKLNLGMVYATQEVSSISSNILKNTQNWFIAHLNNDDETREIRKYYDFGDFTDSLVRFSSGSDKGFVRMKTYANPYVVPVQIDRFSAKKESKA
ncbi:MAG: ATPase [Phycisphaeraceae bacterium]|nr:ATPase [Phycisphaeraceae bacterium]